MPHSHSLRPERGEDSVHIASLQDIIFGEAQKVRAAYALREGLSHELPLSFVATALVSTALVSEDKDDIIGTVRQTKIYISKTPIFLLGPLGVHPDYKNQGIGSDLMHKSLDAARSISDQSGMPKHVLLVGDLDYYAPFGFQPTIEGSIILPRPADPSRILVCPLVPDDNSVFPIGRAVSVLSG